MHCSVYAPLDLIENDTRLSKLFMQHLWLKNKNKSLLHTLRKQVDILLISDTFGHEIGFFRLHSRAQLKRGVITYKIYHRVEDLTL